MKRNLALLGVLILVLGLAACGFGKAPETTVPSTAPTTEPTTEPTTIPTTVPTEPVTAAVVGGVDLAGMTSEAAAAALNEVAAGYQLNLTVNGKKLSFSAEELGLKLDSAALSRFQEAAANGGDLPAAIFTYDFDGLKTLLKKQLNVAPSNASVTYSGGQGKFIVVPGSNGTEYDVAAAANAAAASIGLLIPEATAEVKTTSVAPTYTADSDKVKSAVNTANGYLKLSLTYTYSPEGGTTAKESIGVSTLATFIKVNSKMEVSVSKSAIENYADKMSDRHSGGDYKAKFKTTGGSTIGTKVTYYGHHVDKDALADDIYKCVTSGTSGTRTAPYSAKSDKPYGGSYVEIDLTNQKLYLYKNGERLLTTSLVSGSVVKGYCTPTGVYSIYSKQTDRYLTGADYRSFVSYWMPFLGGYGLHDATWRSSFGGTIYHYNGSHGCVNLPKSAAKTVYNNVSVGTKVILYGGKTEVPAVEQKLTGTTSYTVKADAAAFKLDVKAKYSGAKLTYASSDTSVVTVASDGTVTIKGPGKATITVKAEAFDKYSDAELKVTITVEEAAVKPTEPKPTEPKPTEPKPTEPKPTEPKPTEPKPTEPKPTEPKPTEPKPTEPKPTEPAPTEPKPTEPAPTEPKPTEPAPTEPAPTDPAPVTEPAE